MKEATGELNSSVLIVTAVALLAAFFFTIIWPKIKGDLEEIGRCANAICEPGFNDNNRVYCYTPKKSGVFECPYKGGSVG